MPAAPPPADVEGGPGGVIDGTTLRPRITDRQVFRQGDDWPPRALLERDEPTVRVRHWQDSAGHRSRCAGARRARAYVMRVEAAVPADQLASSAQARERARQIVAGLSQP